MHLFSRHPLIAHHPKQLTTAWAQHIIDQQSPGTRVNNITISAIDIGTTTRVSVTVDHNGAKSLPRQWFIKLPSLKWKARAITALPRLLHTEARFYNEIAQLAPVSKPMVLSAKSILARGSTLVLKDVSEAGAIPGKPTDKISLKQAFSVIELMAALHAPFWDEAHLNTDYQWLAGPVRKLEDFLGSALAVPLMKRGLKKAGDRVPQALHKPAIHYARHRKAAMQFLSQGPQTLIHHDCHPGNFFWQQSQPGLLDWQLVRIGEGISDISYFLATSLEAELRRSNETQLIQHYIQALNSKGISEIDYTQTHSRYRAHLVYSFEAMLITLAVGDMMKLEDNLELIERTSQAVDDNDAFDALPI